jgi:glutathione S-transferase
MLPDIRLFELGPTRSARVRWMLLEAGLEFESVGNAIEVFSSAELWNVHPLGKLPAATIDGRPLFESAALVTAIADLVPERGLIAPPDGWGRNLHWQWVCFALTEIEAYLHSSELNTLDFPLPSDEHVPAIVAQNTRMITRAAAVLDEVLGRNRYLVDDRFSATDVVVGYTVLWMESDGLLADRSNLVAYLDQLCEREHCTLAPIRKSSPDHR